MINGLVFLTFIMCLGPHQCQEFNGGRFDTIGLCALAAQPAIAMWLVEHPQYEFEGSYTCGPDPAQEGKEI